MEARSGTEFALAEAACWAEAPSAKAQAAIAKATVRRAKTKRCEERHSIIGILFELPELLNSVTVNPEERLLLR
jgi:hypothetical protein